MLPQAKLVLPTTAVSGTNGQSIASANIDTLGVDYVTIDIVATTQSASTAGSPSTLKLQESDTTVVTSFADVVGFRGGSAAAINVDFVVPIGVTSGQNTYKFNVDCRARKRYLNVVAVPTTTQTFNVAANGFRNEQAPVTATKANVLALVEG